MMQSYTTCKCCGEKFITAYRNMRDYVYKLPCKTGYAYYCSYTCYRKELNRDDQRRKELGMPSKRSRKV